MEFVGKRACVVIDFGDESELVFFGNPTGCRIRYPLLNESSVSELVTDRKVIDTKHLYRYKKFKSKYLILEPNHLIQKSKI